MGHFSARTIVTYFPENNNTPVKDQTISRQSRPGSGGNVACGSA